MISNFPDGFKIVCEGVQSSNILSFCVKEIISQPWLVQKPFFHPVIRPTMKSCPQVNCPTKERKDLKK